MMLLISQFLELEQILIILGIQTQQIKLKMIMTLKNSLEIHCLVGIHQKI